MVDEKNRRILGELMKDGRLSYADLGRRVRMSRQAVYSRVKTLKNKGIIKKFTIDVNEKELGLKLKAYVLIEAEPIRKYKEDAINHFRKLPQITQIHHLFGRYAYIMEVVVEDVDELSEVVKDIHDSELVRRTETMIVFRTEKHRPQHPVEDALGVKRSIPGIK